MSWQKTVNSFGHRLVLGSNTALVAEPQFPHLENGGISEPTCLTGPW